MKEKGMKAILLPASEEQCSLEIGREIDTNVLFLDFPSQNVADAYSSGLEQTVYMAEAERIDHVYNKNKNNFTVTATIDGKKRKFNFKNEEETQAFIKGLNDGSCYIDALRGFIIEDDLNFNKALSLIDLDLLPSNWKTIETISHDP